MLHAHNAPIIIPGTADGSKAVLPPGVLAIATPRPVKCFPYCVYPSLPRHAREVTSLKDLAPILLRGSS